MSYLQGEIRLANARLWHQISAKNCILGRLASTLACLLMGKHKPIYHPAADVGDYVIVTNCALLRLDTRKLNRTYVRHTGRPGGLKKWTMKQWIEREGASAVLRHAVSRMLPKNRLRDRRLDRLKCFEGESHPYYKNIQRVWTSSGKWLSTPI
ncbi:ribosomal protein L13 [Pneumocystis murina B123]|uniref:Ribosomal protein L13 n=1 Tax=Pneumocystis murina (strain B123) TaxID=1069680 RepID=M7P9P2_PNEMU|nr:ribosomal protein L13 [Pneumocystis murina B123]EMR10590.1 ribosomal protein L13 [Pneumocystis murina B123]